MSEIKEGQIYVPTGDVKTFLGYKLSAIEEVLITNVSGGYGLTIQLLKTVNGGPIYSSSSGSIYINSKHSYYGGHKNFLKAFKEKDPILNESYSIGW